VQKPLGEVLRKARQDADLSLRDLSRLTGLPVGQLSQIETSPQRDPGFSTMMKLARALKVSLDALAAVVSGEKGAVHSALTPSEREYLEIRRELENVTGEVERAAVRLRALTGTKRPTQRRNRRKPLPE
jgi:transcriptional regulator with XRE-family HTH domain